MLKSTLGPLRVPISGFKFCWKIAHACASWQAISHWHMYWKLWYFDDRSFYSLRDGLLESLEGVQNSYNTHAKNVLFMTDARSGTHIKWLPIVLTEILHWLKIAAFISIWKSGYVLEATDHKWLIDCILQHTLTNGFRRRSDSKYLVNIPRSMKKDFGTSICQILWFHATWKL